MLVSLCIMLCLILFWMGWDMRRKIETIELQEDTIEVQRDTIQIQRETIDECGRALDEMENVIELDQISLRKENDLLIDELHRFEQALWDRENS